MNKLILSLLLVMIAGSAMAELEVIDDSQRYAYNEVDNNQAQTEQNNAAYVVSDNEQHEAIGNKGSEEASKLHLLFSKIESLQQELAELRGKIEVQTHQLEQVGVLKAPKSKGHLPLTPNRGTLAPEEALSQQVPTVTAPIESQKADMSVIKKEVAHSPRVRRGADPMDEQLSYVAAYEYVKQKKYQQAIPAMQDFIAAYPDGPYVANAHYWLGELYGVTGEYKKALSEFNVVIQDFSDSNKLSAAQYKLGVTYEKIGEKELAQSEFLKVTEAFPGTAVARLAKAKLK